MYSVAIGSDRELLVGRRSVLLQTVRSELAGQRRARDAENSRRGALIVVRQLQRELERFALDVAQTLAVGGNPNLAERRRAADRAGARAALVDDQMLGADQRAVGTRRSRAR